MAKPVGIYFLVAVVTVNDYLAQRDAEWMGRVHRFLGLSVGLIQVGFTGSLCTLPSVYQSRKIMVIRVVQLERNES